MSFILIEKIQNANDLHVYIQNENISFSKTRSQLCNCTICKKNNNRQHKMREAKRFCRNPSCNDTVTCPKQFMTRTCQFRNKVAFYSTNEEHNSTTLAFNRHGMSSSVKLLIEKLIYNYDSRPKHIHIKLNKNKYKKKLDLMPTLRQK